MASLIPRRLRQVCGRVDLGVPSGTGSRRHWDRPIDLLHGRRSTDATATQILQREGEGDFEINHVVLSGLIAADPQRDKSRDGDPITVLLISFPAADERSRRGSACCEVEILDEIADRHRESLYAGAPILVSGEVTGAGGIWAKLIGVGEES